MDSILFHEEIEKLNSTTHRRRGPRLIDAQLPNAVRCLTSCPLHLHVDGWQARPLRPTVQFETPIVWLSMRDVEPISMFITQSC